MYVYCSVYCLLRRFLHTAVRKGGRDRSVGGLAFPVVCARAMDKSRVIVLMEDVEGKDTTTSMRSLGHSRLLCGKKDRRQSKLGGLKIRSCR